MLMTGGKRWMPASGEGGRGGAARAPSHVTFEEREGAGEGCTPGFIRERRKWEKKKKMKGESHRGFDCGVTDGAPDGSELLRTMRPSTPSRLKKRLPFSGSACHGQWHSASFSRAQSEVRQTAVALRESSTLCSQSLGCHHR